MNIEIRQRSSPQVSPIKRKPTLSNKNPKKGLFGLHWRNKTLPTSAIPPERKSKFQVINQPSADLGEKTKVSLPTEKLDILGQRVIEEFNILLTKKELRNRIAKYSLLEQKQSKRRSNLSILNAFEKHCSKRDSESIIHEVNTTINADELLLAFNNKNDNRTSANLDNEASFNEGVVNMDLNLSKRSSFRSPSVTLNWSHSMNMTIDMDYEPIQDGKIPNPPEVLPDLLSDNMDNSGDLAEEDFHSTKSHISFTEDEVLSSSMLEKLQEDSRHMTPQPEQKNEKNQEEEPVLLPVSELDFKPCTDIPQVDDSFAMEAQKLTSSLQINSPTNTAGVTGTISQQGEELVFSLEPLHQTISYQSFNNRFSIRNISRESCSTHKSYVTYDSDLSHIDISGSVEYDSFGYKSLKKKTGFSSLRIGVLNEQLLRELPFYEQPDEQACQECAPVSGEVLSSDDELTPTMILEHQRPRSRLLQLFQEDLSVTKKETRESGVQPESSPKSSNVSMISSVSSSSFVLPYPGLSTTAIAELAAIPDDAGLEDPIQAALNKLEANDKEEAMSLYGLNDEVEHFNNQPSTQRPSLEELKIQENVIDLFINNPLQKTPITVHQNTPTPKQVFKDELELSESDISKSELSSSTSGKENATKIIATNFDHTVENTMSNGNHISFVLSYDSELLAQHFTNIEKDALSEVDWKELVEMKWESTLEPIHSWFELLLSKISNNGVNLIISRFNLMNNWIISEILLTANLEDRMLTISKFIHIAKHCQSLQNYATLLQIVLALNSTRISRLKSTWEGINAGDILILRSLEKITYPSKNFRNLRIELDKVTASKGCIPFIGIYLNDLIFNNERPSVIKKNVESSIQTKVKIINSLAEDDTELINISKFSLLSSIVKNLLQMIDWSKFYDFKTDKEILSKCLYIRSLSEKEMDYCFNCIAE
ncbi:GQ68_03828T0 [Komagataella phaffii GS115]|nr:GQ68_03828T0 [Komagataella phaffii GS115]